MADQSAIEWTDTTWNPVTGCDRVSPGCAHCYALDLAARLKRMGQAKYQRDGDPKTSGPGFGVTLHERELDKPPRWQKPRRVFVNSMSDLFHEEVPEQFIARVFGVMARCPAHTFQVLTKRPERMRDVLTRLYAEHPGALGVFRSGEPIPNVWLGVSIENRRFVHRADLLRETPAAVRFISAEPLLGPLVHDASDWRPDPTPDCRFPMWEDGYEGPELDLTDIDWLIVGGESGSGHRPINPQWVRDLRDACFALQAGDGEWDVAPDGSGISHACRRPRPAFFFKQWGGAKPTSGGRELDGRTWDEFPEVVDV